MPITRAFKSGNDQAVRIPKELAYVDPDQELSISRVGDVITIYPAHGSLRDAIAALRELPKPPEVETRETIDLRELNVCLEQRPGVTLSVAPAQAVRDERDR